MTDVKWIKITTDMFEDEKIDFIQSLPESDAILIVWIRLLTMAGKCNTNGYIFLSENIPYDENMLAHKFKKPINIIKLALETFKRLQMIEINGKGIVLLNWEKHQSIVGLDKIREQHKLAQRSYRERQKLLIGDVTGDITVMVPSISTSISSSSSNVQSTSSKKGFEKPTLEDVKNYCQERGNNVNYVKWMDHYTSNGWMVGKNKMKDWRAAVRTWEQNSNSKQNSKSQRIVDM